MARPRKLTDAERLENKLKSQNSEVNKQRRRENSIIYYYNKEVAQAFKTYALYKYLKSKGIDVGSSKIEEDLVEVAGTIMKKASEKGIRLYLPVDAVAADTFSPDAVTKIVPVDEIPKGWMFLDIGPATSMLFAEALYDAKTIVWNGPLGAFEMDAFSRGTMAMVNSLANSHALTIVGGGDTDTAVHKAGEADRITFISTGGGAFLELLEGKTLPGVAALMKAGN